MNEYCLHLRNPALPSSPQRGQFGSWRKKFTWQQPKNGHLRIYTGINAQTLKKKYLPPPPSDQMHLMEKDFMKTSNTSLFFRKWVKKRKCWKLPIKIGPWGYTERRGSGCSRQPPASITCEQENQILIWRVVHLRLTSWADHRIEADCTLNPLDHFLDGGDSLWCAVVIMRHWGKQKL